MEEKFIENLQSQLEAAQKVTGSRNKAKNLDALDGTVETKPPERSLRSVAGASKDGSSGLDWANLLKDKEKDSRPAPKRRTVNPPNPLSLLEKTIDEKELRADLLHIVKDLEQRAASFNKRQKTCNTVHHSSSGSNQSTEATATAITTKPHVQVLTMINTRHIVCYTLFISNNYIITHIYSPC